MAIRVSTATALAIPSASPSASPVDYLAPIARALTTRRTVLSGALAELGEQASTLAAIADRLVTTLRSGQKVLVARQWRERRRSAALHRRAGRALQARARPLRRTGADGGYTSSPPWPTTTAMPTCSRVRFGRSASSATCCCCTAPAASRRTCSAPPRTPAARRGGRRRHRRAAEPPGGRGRPGRAGTGRGHRRRPGAAHARDPRPLRRGGGRAGGGRLMGRPALFLDRDGTLVEPYHYPSHPEHLRLYPTVGPELRRLQQAGFASSWSRTRPAWRAATSRTPTCSGCTSTWSGRWRAGGCASTPSITARTIPTGPCPRSPCAAPVASRGPGMLLQAAADLDVDLRRSWLVGDILDDVEAARAPVRPCSST